MSHADSFVPRQYPGVMVSSTFHDFAKHREALIRVISGQGLHPVAMEQDSARPAGTVVDSSLQKVRDAAAYVGIIGHRYGNVPESAEHNPDGLSLTELEFQEARRLGRPVLLFVMGPDHDVKVGAVERDPAKMAKLEAFRADAKRASADSPVHRVYKVFNSLSEFEAAAAQSVAELRRQLETESVPAAPVPSPSGGKIPAPPALYAEPQYIGSHVFVGRTAQLETLTDWAAAAEPHPVLLFEAIGGTGKSMLTWEWTTRHAPDVRADWAGRFWYSFYEKGAIMADFCRRALAYMTGQPLATFRKRRQPELTDLLLWQLQAKPWLLILDGLERVLVAYHRYDAAQLADERAGRSDVIAHRDPCAAIRPEDDDLLRSLAAAAPSKILVTSRLVPRVLLNPSNQAIPGVLQERLPGLRPADAEVLLRGCGVRGDSEGMQDYLRRHCDCHPLVTGVVAGLVQGYLPARGDFDAWAADPDHGGRLNLAELDLVQKRNHILTSAVDALSDTSRQLLSTLALLPETADYATLEALNPHRTAVPESDDGHPAEHQDRIGSVTPEAAALTRTVQDLERRGLLQYDGQVGRYDLHPVVRGVASGGLGDADRDTLGQRVLDHFSRRPHNPYERAETLDELRDGMTVVRTLLRMGRMDQACVTYRGALADALIYNVEASAEVVSLLRPFFGRDWTTPSARVSSWDFSYVANSAAIALRLAGETELIVPIHAASMAVDCRAEHWSNVGISLGNLAVGYAELNRVAAADRCVQLALELAEAVGDRQDLFLARFGRFKRLVVHGMWEEAQALWDLLDRMGRDWTRTTYRAGSAELSYARLQFERDALTASQLAAVERLLRDGRNRHGLRGLLGLRGRWLLNRGEYSSAVASLREAIRMAHEAGLRDVPSETHLALARCRLGERSAAREIALDVSAARQPSHLALAELWHALSDDEQAIEHARKAHRHAWADGEPYVHRYQLTRVEALLKELGTDVPVLPPYDPPNDPALPWELEIIEAVERLRADRRRA